MVFFEMEKGTKKKDTKKINGLQVFEMKPDAIYPCGAYNVAIIAEAFEFEKRKPSILPYGSEVRKNQNMDTKSLKTISPSHKSNERDLHSLLLFGLEGSI